MDEIWKPINGFNEAYQISNLGRVKSVTRKIHTHHKGYDGYRVQREKLLTATINNRGYAYVSLRSGNRYKHLFIHRLVAEAFIPNPNNLPFVNHIDENPQNNCVDNLEWCTPKYNCNYGDRNKKISESRKGMKFTDAHIENMRKAGKARVNDEFREKMRQVHLGTKLSDTQKKKISEGVKRHYRK